VPDDDDILRAYERELGDAEFPDQPRRSNRGFWLVVGALAVSSIVLVVEIFANRPIATTIGHAQFDLRQAQAVASQIRSSTGSFVAAGAAGLNEANLNDGELTAVGPDEASSGLDELSVYADEETWAAAVSVTPGACFYLRLDTDRQDPLYGVGTTCTAREALGSRDDRW
jgi:hypothetical protein